MIPIRDTIPSRSFPIVTTLLIALNVGVFLYELSVGPQLDELFAAWALVPRHFTHPAQYPLHWTPVFASMFLHGSVWHVGGNMLYLWIFGDNVEDRLGHLRYLIFYLLCGVLAALTHVYFEPLSRVPMVGASGAIAGVLGAYFITYPRSRVLTWFPPIFFFHLPAVLFLGFWFVMQVLNGGMSLHAGASEAGGVAFTAHAGGFVAGVLLCVLMRPADRALPSPYDHEQ